MKIRSVLSIAIVLLLIVVNAGAVDIQPQKLYGNVTIDGSPAIDGTIISAVKDTIEIAKTSTAGGQYGYGTQMFYVPEVKDTFKLLVNGIYATEISFKSGDQTRLDLSIKTGSPVETLNKPSSRGSSGVQADNNPKIPPPMPQTNATVQSTPVVSPTPVLTTSVPDAAQDITPSGTPAASAIDGVLSIITLLFAGIILRTIKKK